MVIGAIAAAGAGIAGAMASADAAEKNWQINLLNYYQRERERRESKQEARKIRSEQKLGGYDAQGNRTYFDPVKGWVTELSPVMEELQNKQQTEQRRILDEDLPMKRLALKRQNKRQLKEGSVADGQLLSFLNQRNVSQEEISGKLRNAAARGNSRVYNELAKEAATTAINRDAPNAADTMNKVGQNAASNLSRQLVAAELQGMDKAREVNRSNKSGKLNLYNLLASRASAPLNVAYSPQNITGAAQSSGSNFANLLSGGNSALMQATMKQGGVMDYVEPDMGIANAIGGAGTAFQSAFDASEAKGDKKDANSMLMQYLLANSQGKTLEQGGILEAMNARVNVKGGLF